MHPLLGALFSCTEPTLYNYVETSLSKRLQIILIAGPASSKGLRPRRDQKDDEPILASIIDRLARMD